MWAVCLIIPSYRGHPFSEPPSVFPPLPSTSPLHSLQLFTIQTLRKMQRVLCPILAKMSMCPPAWRCWEHQVGAAPESKQSCLGNNSRGRRAAAVAYLRLWLRNMNLEQHLDFFLILFFVFLQIAGLFFFFFFFSRFIHPCVSSVLHFVCPWRLSGSGFLCDHMRPSHICTHLQPRLSHSFLTTYVCKV